MSDMNDFNDSLAIADRQIINTFGVPVTLPLDRFPVSILGIFDDPSKRVDVPDGGRFDGVMPTVQLIQSEMNGLARRDIITIEERPTEKRKWYVKDVDPDGCGLCTVYLSETDPGANQGSYGGLY